MNRVKQRSLLLAGLLAAGVGGGCEGFLDTVPQGSLDELTLLSRDGVEATLIGAYRMLGGFPDNWPSAPSNWLYSNITSDDAYKGSEPNDQPEANEIELYNWSGGGAHNYLNTKWEAVYEGVRRANATLSLLARVMEEKPGEISEADARSIRGEALFLRAHFHFEAWRFWGSIPYYTEEDTDYYKPNAGTDAIALILQDLDEAISLLQPMARGTGADKGRVNQWTAKAYKGRVLVYVGRYAEALPVLTDVVTNGPYRLQENFYQVWSAMGEYQNGPETILAYQAAVNAGDPNGAPSNSGERLNFPHSGSPFGCCGFNQPSQNLVNFFKVDANGLPLALSVGDLTPLDATAAWNADNDNFTASRTDPVDPRLDWTVGRDGVPYKDWGLHSSTEGWVRDISNGGYYNGKKHVHEEGSGSQSTVGWNNAHLNGMNFHIFRYADLLLLLAEAEVEAGSLENARQIVNQIRERAGKVAQGCGLPSNPDRAAKLLAVYPHCANDSRVAVPIDDPSIKWATYRIGLYTTPWTDKEFARSAVRYERRLELAMEGQRFFDLRRWDIFEDVLNKYIEVEKTRRPHKQAALPVTRRHKWYPIPNRQIELSVVDGQSRLTQVEGWR